MRINKKLRYSVLANLILLIFIAIPVIYFNSGKSNYFRCGWYEDFIFISIKIDTCKKYLFLCIMLILSGISNVIILDIAHPILFQYVYNPDKKEITEFTLIELNILANTMYFIEMFKRVLTVLVTISQIDVALLSGLSEQFAGLFTVRYLLKQKKFISKNYIKIDNLPSYHSVELNNV